jgi:microcystin-dependent protein
MEPFLGQLQLFAFGLIPRGWVPCDGRILPVAQYQALYALLGNTFGGNGPTTFALPDLRGKAPVGAGQLTGGAVYTRGQVNNAETVQLTPDQIPAHNHGLQATTTPANISRPPGALLADTTQAQVTMYAPQLGSTPAQLSTAAIAYAGASQGHENRQPFLAMNWCIALVGIFPSQN